MADPESTPDGVPVEEALLRMMGPDLLRTYREESDRHREAKRNIEQIRKRSRATIRRFFRPPLREEKEARLEEEHRERVEEEANQHARFLRELREAILRHWDTPPGQGT